MSSREYNVAEAALFQVAVECGGNRSYSKLSLACLLLGKHSSCGFHGAFTSMGGLRQRLVPLLCETFVSWRYLGKITPSALEISC